MIVRRVALLSLLALYGAAAQAGEAWLTLESGGERLALNPRGALVLLQERGAGEGPALTIRLSQADAGGLEALTAKRVGHRVTVVFEERTLIAPVTRAPVTSGQIVIAGPPEEVLERVIAAWRKAQGE